MEQVKFTDSDSPVVQHVINDNNSEYYVEAFQGADGSPWIAIVENNNANDNDMANVAKDLIRSLELVAVKA